MAKASKILMSNGTVPATPAAGYSGLYFDSAATVSPGFKAIDSAGGTYQFMGPSTNDFRLTGVSNTPIMTADSSTLATMYLTPFKGNYISLYNGTSWDLIESAQVSLAISGRTADLPFDIFAYNVAGVVTLEFLDWTNSTTRATALVRQDGVWCKTGSLTRRYLGSCRPRISTQFAWIRNQSDLTIKFDLFNADNRVSQSFFLGAAATSWSYASATIRQAQGSALYQVNVMVGLQEEAMNIGQIVTSSAASNTYDRYTGIGYDSTTAFSGTRSTSMAGVANQFVTQQGRFCNRPGIGTHYYAWLESVTNTITFYGDNAGLLLQSGMTGTWTC